MSIEIELFGGLHDGLILNLAVHEPVPIEIPDGVSVWSVDEDEEQDPADPHTRTRYEPVLNMFGGYSATESGAVRYQLCK